MRTRLSSLWLRRTQSTSWLSVTLLFRSVLCLPDRFIHGYIASDTERGQVAVRSMARQQQKGSGIYATSRQELERSAPVCVYCT